MSGSYTPERLAELKAVAKAATPGPWYRKDSEANGTLGIEYIDAVEGDPFHEGGYSEIADCSYVRHWEGRISQNVDLGEIRANATHISTFDPPQVLALIAEIEKLAHYAKTDTEQDDYRMNLEYFLQKILLTWESFGDEYVVRLPLIMPGGSNATVRIIPKGNCYYVGDLGLAFQEADSMGYKASFWRTADALAQQAALERNKTELGILVSSEDLYNAVCEVALVSWKVANAVGSLQEG